eukprot:COSAG05_NODE_1080_length_5950_cov_1.563323_7_plen_84_part_00
MGRVCVAWFFLALYRTRLVDLVDKDFSNSRAFAAGSGPNLHAHHSRRGLVLPRHSVVYTSPHRKTVIIRPRRLPNSPAVSTAI